MNEQHPNSVPGASPSSPGPGASSLGAERSRLARLFAFLPRGRTLPEPTWRVRHRAILWILWAHVPLLFAFGLFGGTDRWVSYGTFEGYTLGHTLLEAGVVGVFALFASWPRLGRRARSVVASFGLVTASAIFTHFSGGYIEAHFHFFVMVAVIAMYQDWAPFILGILYVALHHGVAGTLDPASVFNHEAAIAHPWRWAAIHAFFITGISAAEVVHWRMSENARAETEAVLHSAGDAIFGLDAAGKIAFANPAAERMADVPEGALRGKDLLALLQPNGGARTTGAADAGPVAALHEGRTHHGVDWILQPEGGDPGQAVPVDWTATPLTERGGVTGAVVTVRDMTERHRAEHEIRALNRRLQSLNSDLERRVALRTHELEAANRELEAFSYSVSHDLRAPLRSMDGFSQALLEDCEEGLDETGKDYLMRIRRSSQRMAQLIDDLLQLSRLTRSDMERTRVDLSKLVEETLATLREEDPEREVDTLVASGVVVEGDPKLLRIAVENLVRNAWKFTREEYRATIEFGTRPDPEDPDGAVVCFVRDNGVGFEPEYADKLFKPFSRLHSAEAFEGTGIGLATVQRIVHRHGGTVSAEGAPGRGATFSIRLPTSHKVKPHDMLQDPPRRGQ